ncbi:MAG TPA: helix-turn-helix domain-containing protein [Steroidobacteraceae bacterium]|nr:helix-turn-helix domain-containing protein [Steroidobacteraceae bacterium]
MTAVQTSLYLVAVALCLFSTGVDARAGRGRTSTYFTVFLLIQSATFIFELLMAHPATPFKALSLASLMASSLLLAPCLWLAFQEHIGGTRPSLRNLPRTHWLPILAGSLLVVPLASSAHAGTTYANPLDSSSWLYSKVIHTTMLLCMGIFVVQVPWYLVRCRRILLTRLAGQQPHWAQWPLAIVATTWMLAIVRTVDCAFLKCPPLFSLTVAVISVGVTIGALYLLLRQVGGESAGVPDEHASARRGGAELEVPQPVAPAAQPIAESAIAPPAEAYAKSPLGAAARARIRRKLEASLARGAYRESGLSLRSLSDGLNESPHYVSQVISQDLGTSFYELVNEHRIREAQRRLRAAPRETVLAIAMDVGFNSKSAFHAAFRRLTGTTPSGFRNGDSPRFPAKGDSHVGSASSPMGQDAEGTR